MGKVMRGNFAAELVLGQHLDAEFWFTGGMRHGTQALRTTRMGCLDTGCIVIEVEV